MQAAYNSLPVPYFRIDSAGVILEASEEAAEWFGKPERLLDLIDLDSREKVERFLGPGTSARAFEVNLATSKNPPKLFDLYQQWDGLSETGHIVFIPKSEAYRDVSAQLKRLQSIVSEPRMQRELPLAATRPEADSGRERRAEALHALANVQELVQLLRTDFIELGRSEVHETVLDELSRLRELLLSSRP